MKRTGLAVLSLVLAGGWANAAAVDTMWLRHFVGDSAKYDNRAADILIDSANNCFYVCGSVEESIPANLGTDMGLYKYSFAGERLWKKALGGNLGGAGSADDMAHALAMDPAGNIYIAGHTTNMSTGTHGGLNWTVAKYQPNGVRLWFKKSLLPYEDAAFDIAINQSGQVYICGSRDDSTEAQTAYFVARLRPDNGETLWTRSYIMDTAAKYPAPKRDLHPDFPNYDWTDWDNCATAIAVDPTNGSIVTTGFGYEGTIGYEYDWWTMRHDSLGNRVWASATRGGASIPDDDDAAFDVVVDNLGAVYVAGFAYEGATPCYDFAVQKLNGSTGAMLYRRRLNDGAWDDDDCAYSLCLDNANPQNLYVTGYVGYAPPVNWQAVTAKYTTPTMGAVWGVSGTGAIHGGAGDDIGYKVLWKGGKVYVAGVKGGTVGTSDDCYLLCYSDANAVGTVKDTIWTWSYNSRDSLEDYLACVAVLDSNNVYVAGQCDRDSLARPWTSMVTARLYHPRIDAAVTAILAPVDTVSLGDSIVPRALVRNLGTGSASFKSHLAITPGYSDSVQNSGLAPGDSLVDSFTVWVPSTLGQAVVRCTVALAGDTITANNVMVETVFVALRDVACSLVVAPTGTVDSGAVVTPQAWLVNYGNIAEQFDAVMTIGDFYADTLTVNLPIGGNSLVAFAAETLVARGSWDVACSTMLAGDPNPANNRSTGSVRVRVTDAALLAIEALPDTVDSGTVITPQLRVANLGTDSAAVRGKLIILHGASVFYSESVDVALAPVEERLVDLAQTAPFAPIGDWTAAARVELASDQVSANDSLGSGFFVGPVSGITWPPGWTEVASVPLAPSGRYVKDGGCLSVVELADTAWIYALKGYKASDFYRYNFHRNAWQDRAPIPTGLEGKPPYRGTQMNEEVRGSIYATKGNNTLGFWRYSPPGDSWYQLVDVPLGINRKKVKGGTDVVRIEHAGNEYIYLMKGYRNEFYRYDVAAGTWQNLAEMPVGTNPKWYKGSFLVGVGDRHVYALKGKYNEFWRHTVGTDSWTQMAALPLYNSAGRRKKAGDGASGAYYNGSIYALKGGNTNEFWRYDIATDLWTQLAADSLPSFGSSMRKKRVKAGSDLVYNSYALWAAKGNKTLEFWRWGIPLGEAARAPERTAQASSGVGPVRVRQFAVAPNPMSGRGVLRYSVPSPALLSVRLYDAAGRVARVAAESRPVAGSGALDLDTRGLAPGVYLVRVDAGVGVPVTSLKLLLQ